MRRLLDTQTRGAAVRFADFLDESTPESLADSTHDQPVPHQHVLGPPPSVPSDVSAFAELFGASLADTPVESAPAVAESVEVQTAIDAIILPTLVSETEVFHEAPPVAQVPPAQPEPNAALDVVNDDLLPNAGRRSEQRQPARAWSRGRSKR